MSLISTLVLAALGIEKRASVTKVNTVGRVIGFMPGIIG
jgi:hypothetical protein